MMKPARQWSRQQTYKLRNNLDGRNSKVVLLALEDGTGNTLRGFKPPSAISSSDLVPRR